MKIIVTLILIFLGGLLTASAQTTGESSQSQPKVVVEKYACGLRYNSLGSLIQYSKKDDVIIIISHIGKGEADKFGKRRLSNAKTFLTQETVYYKKPPEFVVTAEGEKVGGEGYLDFYVHGEFEVRIFIEKNKDLYLGDCGAEPDQKPCQTAYEKLFYPCKAN